MASVFTASEQDSFVIPGPVAGPTAGWIHSLETPTSDGYAQSFGSPGDAAPSSQLGEADRFPSTQHTELPHAPRSAFNPTPAPRSVAATLPPYETTSSPVSPPLRNIQSARPLDYMTSHRFSQPPQQTGPLPPTPSHGYLHSPVRSFSETGGPNVFPPPQENRIDFDDRLNGWFDQLSISPPPRSHPMYSYTAPPPEPPVPMPPTGNQRRKAPRAHASSIARSAVSSSGRTVVYDRSVGSSRTRTDGTHRSKASRHESGPRPGAHSQRREARHLESRDSTHATDPRTPRGNTSVSSVENAVHGILIAAGAERLERDRNGKLFVSRASR
jgi:hypothetical protein